MAGEPGGESADRLAIRALCLWLVAVQLGFAAFNMAFLRQPTPVGEALRGHIESPERRPPEPSTARAARPTFGAHTRRLAVHLFDLDRECNLTTWFAAAQLAVLGVGCIALRFRRARRGWLVLGLAMLYLSVDESVQLHEWIGTRLAESGWAIGRLDPPYPWVILLGPPLLGFAVWALRFLARELAAVPQLRRWTVVGLLLMAASLPLEVVGGWIQGAAPRPPRIEVVAEETAETLGVTFLIYVVLTLLIRPRLLAVPPTASSTVAAGRP